MEYLTWKYRSYVGVDKKCLKSLPHVFFALFQFDFWFVLLFFAFVLWCDLFLFVWFVVCFVLCCFLFCHVLFFCFVVCVVLHCFCFVVFYFIFFVGGGVVLHCFLFCGVFCFVAFCFALLFVLWFLFCCLFCTLLVQSLFFTTSNCCDLYLMLIGILMFKNVILFYQWKCDPCAQRKDTSYSSKFTVQILTLSLSHPQAFVC